MWQGAAVEVSVHTNTYSSHGSVSTMKTETWNSSFDVLGELVDSGKREKVTMFWQVYPLRYVL